MSTHPISCSPDAADPTDHREVVIGLLADPNLPTKLALRMAEDLPDALAEQVGDDVHWRIETVHEPFEIATSDDRVIDKARARVGGTNWDIAICMTDIPMVTDNGVVVADVSRHDCVALVSLPALGGLRLRRRTREVLVEIIDGLVAHLHRPRAPDGSPAERAGTALGTHLARRVAPVDRDVDIELVMGRRPGTLRLLAGTVRANQPWHLAIGLSSALAGATAGSAFGILYTAIWALGVVLEPWRLAAGTFAAITVLAVWLIVGHGLWLRQPRRTQLGRMQNAATVLTIMGGVLVFYSALYVLNLTAAALLIPPQYFAEVAGRPVDWSDYLRVALMATGMGTVAGAVGSGLEDDTTVRKAAYSTREQQRRAGFGT